VRELAVEVLDSFEKLEILLAVAGAGAAAAASGPYPAQAIIAATALDAGMVAEALAELVASGVLVASATGYSLAADAPWTVHVGALVQLHRSDRMLVVSIMSQAAVNRLRLRAERAFADAFVFRSRKGDHDR
jgi:hypothetical protein